MTSDKTVLQRPQKCSQLLYAKRGISKKWYQRLGTFGGIRDLRPGNHLVGETRDMRL